MRFGGNVRVIQQMSISFVKMISYAIRSSILSLSVPWEPGR